MIRIQDAQEKISLVKNIFHSFFQKNFPIIEWKTISYFSTQRYDIFSSVVSLASFMLESFSSTRLWDWRGDRALRFWGNVFQSYRNENFIVFLILKCKIKIWSASSSQSRNSYVKYLQCKGIIKVLFLHRNQKIFVPNCSIFGRWCIAQWKM